MRATLVGLALVAGCGFSPHQNYVDTLDAGGDRVVALDASQPDLRATAGSPDTLHLVPDTLPPGQPETGRRDVLAPGPDLAIPDLAPTRPDAGPEAQAQPDTRAVPDTQPDLMPAFPDVAPDLLPDVFAPTDLDQDRGPDVFSRDAGADILCSGCVEPGWDGFCASCTENPRNPVAVACISGQSYDCKGHPIVSPNLCTATGSGANVQGCVGCAQYAGIHCPDPTPYCNTATGACSATPI